MIAALGLEHFLFLAVILFGLGFYTVLTRQNAVGILMGVELILNAANLNFVAFDRYGVTATAIAPGAAPAGMMIPVFVIMIAAAEVAVGLAIVLAMFKNWGTIDTDRTRSLRD